MGRISKIPVAAIVFATIFAHGSWAIAEEFELRSWTDRKGNQALATFVDARNGEVRLKTDDGKINTFKLADFADVEQKYLRDLAAYKRKLAAGEKVDVPPDPIKAANVIQPPQAADAGMATPARKPLSELPIRVWTDVTGRKIQGKFMTVYGEKTVVDLKGQAVEIPFERLSADDQEYVRIQLTALARNDLITALTSPKTVVAAAGPANAFDKNNDVQSNIPNPTVVASVPVNPASMIAEQAMAEQLRRHEEARQKAMAGGDQVATAAQPSFRGNPSSPFPAAPTNDFARRRERFEEQRKMTAEASAKPRPVHVPRPVETYVPPAPLPTRQVTQSTQFCSGCGKEVSSRLKAGDSCPHCKMFFATDQHGGKADPPSSWSPKGRGVGKLLYLIIAGVVGAVGFIIKKMQVA